MALPIPTFYTAKSVLSGTTLVSDAAIPADAGDLIIVSVANNAAAGDTSLCEWGATDMNHRPGLSQNNVGGRRINTYFFRAKKNGSRDITVTWPVANSNRAMIIAVVKETVRRDVVQQAIQDLSTTPTTGTTPTITGDEEMALAFMVSDGDRTTDAAGTPSGGFALGDRVGTTGLDFRVYYDDLTGTTPLAGVSCSLTSATSRDWTSVIVALYKAVSLDTQIVIYGGNYESLLDSTDASKQNAMLVYLQAYYTDILPITPSAEWLAGINITGTDYDNAVTLLQNLGIIETRTDDAFLIRTVT